VDDEGNSLDAHGRIIDTKDYFISQNDITTRPASAKTSIRAMLSQRIVSEYHRINRIFASHLVAFIAFEMWQRQFPKTRFCSLFLRLPEEELEISIRGIPGNIQAGSQRDLQPQGSRQGLHGYTP